MTSVGRVLVEVAQRSEVQLTQETLEKFRVGGAGRTAAEPAERDAGGQKL